MRDNQELLDFADPNQASEIIKLGDSKNILAEESKNILNDHESASSVLWPELFLHLDFYPICTRSISRYLQEDFPVETEMLNTNLPSHKTCFDLISLYIIETNYVSLAYPECIRQMQTSALLIDQLENSFENRDFCLDRLKGCLKLGEDIAEKNLLVRDMLLFGKMIIDVLTKFSENDKNLLNLLEAFTNRHDVFLNVFAFQIIEDTIDFHTEVLEFYAEILGALGCPLD